MCAAHVRSLLGTHLSHPCAAVSHPAGGRMEGFCSPPPPLFLPTSSPGWDSRRSCSPRCRWPQGLPSVDSGTVTCVQRGSGAGQRHIREGSTSTPDAFSAGEANASRAGRACTACCPTVPRLLHPRRHMCGQPRAAPLCAPPLPLPALPRAARLRKKCRSGTGQRRKE